MSNQIIPGHKVYITDFLPRDILYYINIFGKVSEMDISDTRIADIDHKNRNTNVSISINRFMITDLISTNNWGLSEWMISYNKELLELYAEYSSILVYFNVMVEEYPNYVDISFNVHDENEEYRKILDYCKEHSMFIPITSSHTGVHEMVTVTCCYSITYIKTLFDMIYNYTNSTKTIEEQIICCPHCYDIKGKVKYNLKKNILGTAKSLEDNCDICGKELHDEYILIDTPIYDCIKLLGTSGYCRTRFCCSSHPSVIGDNQAYIAGWIDPKLYNYIDESIHSSNLECDDIIIERALDLLFEKEDAPDEYTRFAIRINNIINTNERSMALSILYGILDRAILKMKEEENK